MTTAPEPPTDTLFGPPKPPSLLPTSAPRVQELARAYIQQSYDVASVLDTGRTGTANNHFSGVDVGARATPVGYFGASAQATYSIADTRMRAAAVSLFLSDPRPVVGADDLSLPGLRPRNAIAFSYRFIDTLDTPNTVNTEDVSDVSLDGTYRITHNLAVSYQGRFDANVGRFLDNTIGMRIISSCDCWVVDFAFEDRVNPNETSFRVLFSLVGLGTFGREPFTPSYSAFTTPRVGPGADLGRSY